MYRQSTGANAFMVAADVLSAFKKRMTRFAASFLETLDDTASDSTSHECTGVQYGDAVAIESCMSQISLTETEELSRAYVAGWLETKCKTWLFQKMKKRSPVSHWNLFLTFHEVVYPFPMNPF